MTQGVVDGDTDVDEVLASAWQLSAEDQARLRAALPAGAEAQRRPAPMTRRLEDLPSLLSSLPHFTGDEVASFAADLAAARITGRFGAR